MIYRGSDASALSPLDTVPTTTHLYNDTDPDAQDNRFYYRIAGVKSTPCYPGKLLKASDGSIKQSLSNLENNGLPSGIGNENTVDDTKLTIHPNPTSGKIYFEVKNAQIQQVRISNLIGKTILERTHLGENKTIDLSSYKRGVFIIYVQTNKDSFTKKIIKK